jgi:Na+-translocating ferredoxin:NAD+ oxidoreductase RnfC subunit
MPQLTRCLDPKTLSALERLQQQEEIRLAGFKDLAECPFCDYKAICPPVEMDWGVIHAQGARIRAQGAPGYVHKEQAHIRGRRLTGVFTSQKGNSTSESGDDAKAVRTRRRAK